MVLQTLVEGMVLEAHVSSENATETPPVHLVELYSQYGSQVCVCVCVWVCAPSGVVFPVRISSVWVCVCVGV